MGHWFVVLLLVINAIVASSYPYSHLARIRSRRIPNPRQIYRNQNMLLRGERGRKAAPEHLSERLRNTPFAEQRPVQTPNRARNHVPYGQPNQPVNDQQQTSLLQSGSRLVNDQKLSYLGNQPLLQKSADTDSSNDVLPSNRSPHLSRDNLQESSDQTPVGADESLPSVATSQGGSLLSSSDDKTNKNGDEPVVRPSLKKPYSQSNPSALGQESQKFSYVNNQPVEQSNRQIFPNQQLPYQQLPDQQPTYQQPSDQQLSYQQPNDQQLPYKQSSDQQLPYQQPTEQHLPYQQPSEPQQPSNPQLPQLPGQQLSYQRLPYQQPSISQLPFQQGGLANGQQLSYVNGRPLPQPAYNQPLPYFNGRQPGPFQQPGYFNNGPLLPNNRQPFSPLRSPYQNEDQLPFRRDGPSVEHSPVYSREENHNHQSHDRREVNAEINSAKSRLGHQESDKVPSHVQSSPSENFLKISGARSEEGVEEPCDETNCPELENCMNSTKEGCCPVCVTHVCKCQGYQYYDCVSNGFKDGLVPEGESYNVDAGSTICSCPTGGGDILCSYQDLFGGENGNSEPMKPRLLCPPPPIHCIESYTNTDGCVECVTLGCVGEEGTKYQAGERVSQERCSTCICPAEGGDIVCQLDAACNKPTEEEAVDDPRQTSLALEATQRVMRDPLSVERSKGLYDRENIEDGYDTRFLQPDWNSFPTDKAAVPQTDPAADSRGAQDGIEKTNIGGIVAPPLVDPNKPNPNNGNQIPPGPFYQEGYNPYNQGSYHGGYSEQYPYSYNYNGGHDSQGQSHNADVPNRQNNNDRGSQRSSSDSDRSPEGVNENRRSEGNMPESGQQDRGSSPNVESGEVGHSDEGDSAPRLQQPFPNYGGQHPGYGGFNYGNNNNLNPVQKPQPLPLPQGENNQIPQTGYRLSNPQQFGQDTPQTGISKDTVEKNVQAGVNPQRYPNFVGYPYLNNGQQINNLPDNSNSYGGQVFPYLPGYPRAIPGYPPYLYPQRNVERVPYGGEIPFPYGGERQQKNFTNEDQRSLHPTSVTRQLLYELNNHSIESNQSSRVQI